MAVCLAAAAWLFWSERAPGAVVIAAEPDAVRAVARDLRTWPVWSHVAGGTWEIDGASAGVGARLVWRRDREHGSVQLVGEHDDAVDLVEVFPYEDLQGEGRRLSFRAVPGGTEVAWEPLRSWPRCPVCIEEDGSPYDEEFMGDQAWRYRTALTELKRFVEAGGVAEPAGNGGATSEGARPARTMTARAVRGEELAFGRPGEVWWGDLGVEATAGDGRETCRRAQEAGLRFLGVTGGPVACDALVVLWGERDGAWRRFGESATALGMVSSPADGLRAGPGASWADLEASAPREVPYTLAVEVFGLRGSSEEYRDHRAVEVEEGRVCPEASPGFEPCCQRAATLVQRLCHQPESAACAAEMELGRLAYLDGGAFGWLRAAQDRGDSWQDWGQCGECTDCWRPVFRLRPRRSLQYLMATRGVTPTLVGGGWLMRDRTEERGPPARDGREDDAQLEWARAALHRGGGLTAVVGAVDGAGVLEELRAGRAFVTTGPRVRIEASATAGGVRVVVDGDRPIEVVRVDPGEGSIDDPWAVVSCASGVVRCGAELAVPDDGARYYARATWRDGAEEHRVWSAVVP